VQDNEFTKILGWPGYRVFQHEIDEGAKTLRLWVRRMRRSRALICSGCGKRVRDVVDASEREVRDLPWGEYRTTVVVEVFRVRCPACGVKIERVPQLPSKAPFSNGSKTPWGWCASRRRRGRLGGSSVWRPVRCGPSTCAI
jgi:transposase